MLSGLIGRGYDGVGTVDVGGKVEGQGRKQRTICINLNIYIYDMVEWVNELSLYNI